MKIYRNEDNSYNLILEGGNERAAAMMVDTGFAHSKGLKRRDRRLAAKFGEYLVEAYPLQVERGKPPVVPEMTLSDRYAEITVKALTWFIESQSLADRDEDVMSETLQDKVIEMYLQTRSLLED